MPLKAQDLLSFFENDLGVDTSDVNETTPLFSSGIIDSFALVTMITHIETQCGFRIAATDVNLDNMDSIERILTYVERSVAK